MSGQNRTGREKEKIGGKCGDVESVNHAGLRREKRCLSLPFKDILKFLRKSAMNAVIVGTESEKSVAVGPLTPKFTWPQNF